MPNMRVWVSLQRAAMFATLGMLPWLHASEKIQGRKYKGGSKLRAVYIHVITSTAELCQLL